MRARVRVPVARLSVRVSRRPVAQGLRDAYRGDMKLAGRLAFVVVVAGVALAVAVLLRGTAVEMPAPVARGVARAVELAADAHRLRPAAAGVSSVVAPAAVPARADVAGEVTVELSEPPASSYLSAPTNDTDRYYDGLVRELSRGKAQYERHLGRAARELVVQASGPGGEPAEARDFLVAGSGAVAGDTVFQHLRTTGEDETALHKAIASVLAEPPSGSGPLRIGVGEVWEQGDRLSRHVGVLGTRLPLEIEPCPATAALGGTWIMHGKLIGTWHDLNALVLRPDGNLETVAPEVDGQQVRVAVPAGDKVGKIEVQLVGTGPDGPGKLVQLRVFAGQPPPRRFTARVAPDESQLASAADAAEWAFELLNRDRARHGMAPLRWDDQLASVARDHSTDMRDSGFFGHLSPRTGLHTQRLDAADYRAVASAENLAHNASIWEAEQGLLHSLGHRRNLLDAEFTHVGIGVAGQESDGGRRRWWVTQLFARPVRDVDEATELQRLRAAVDAQRAGKNLKSLESDAHLDEVASLAAVRVLQGELDGASALALESARERGLLRGRLRAWAASLPELGKLQLPEVLYVPEARRLGLAVAQDRKARTGHVAVVVLVGD
jgi:uncharacterized protein YkwD